MESRADNINLYCIFSDIIRNFWVVLAVAAISCMAVYLADSFILEPQYTSEATFVVNSKATSYAESLNMSTAVTMAGVFKEIFVSDVLRETAALHIGRSELPGKIKANVVTETNIIVVSATADTPNNAFITLNAIMDTYSQISAYVYDNVVLDVVINPTIPTSPSNKINVPLYTVYASLLLSAATIGLIVFLSVIRETVKNPEDVKKYLNANLLGTIYSERKNKTFKTFINRSNKALLITNPAIGFSFTEAVNRLCMKLEFESKNTAKKVFLITSIAENEGKSTVASNLALGLAKKGKKVVLIDADFRRPSIYKIFDRRKISRLDFRQNLIAGKNLDELIDIEEKTNLHLLLANRKFIETDNLFVFEKMPALIENLRLSYDFIIMDTPPMVFSDAESLFGYVDETILVIRQDTVYIPIVNDFISLIKNTSNSFMGCIFNNVHMLPFGITGEKHGYYSKNKAYRYRLNKNQDDEAEFNTYESEDANGN